jgi:hypothetical protein
MKTLMILGSSVGFLADTDGGVVGNRPWSATLWRACAAALVAAVLARWWSRIWLNRLRTGLTYDPHTRSAPRSELKSAARL